MKITDIQKHHDGSLTTGGQRLNLARRLCAKLGKRTKRVAIAFAVGGIIILPIFAAAKPSSPSKQASEIRQLREELAEQTSLYDALGAELQEMEARSTALKKQAQEDQALKLETVCVLKDQGLTTRAHFSPADDNYAVVTVQGTVRIFSLAGKSSRELSLPGERLTAFCYAPEGRRVLAGTSEGRVLLWDLANGKAKPIFVGVKRPICHLLWLPNPERFVVAYDQAVGQYTVFVVQLGDGQKSGEFSSHWQISSYQAIAASADGKWIGALDLPKQQRAGYLLSSTNVAIQVMLRDDCYPSGPLSIGFAPDNNTVAIGYAPHNLSLWNVAQQKEVRMVKAHSNWVTTLGFSPDSRRLISGGGDNTARIWDVATGREIGRIRLQPDGCVYVNAVGFSADGKYVLAAAENGVVIIAKAPN